MFTTVPQFINLYVESLDEEIRKHSPGQKLSRLQGTWLKFCLMGILLTHSVCWAAFERGSLGKYRLGAISWMFRRSRIAWEGIWEASISLVLQQYGLVEGVLVADDTDHQRAKQTAKIWKAYKIFDKKTGGYFNGQTVVFLILVTPKITLPVGFRFYQPDPQQKAWKKEDQRLKKAGLSKAQRPPAPAPDPRYPSKVELVLEMIRAFRKHHPEIKVKAVLADALYGTQAFMDEASLLCGQVQVISQLKSDQTVWFRNRKISLPEYFNRYPGVPTRLRIRGGQEVDVVVGSARLFVCAHGKKRFVIALKYSGETEYRFLVATDLSWRTQDILQTHTLRWLVEVFFEDWKLYEGWGQMAKQPGEEGSSRGLILSLLLDHALLLHPEQRARLENKLPASTVGSLQRLIQGEAILEEVRSVLTAENVAESLAQLAERVKLWFPLTPSRKHMSGNNLGRQEPTPSLRYRAREACAFA
jgi:SRSO17 transposase